MIRVTVADLETGEEEVAEIWNDYIVVVAGDRYIDGVVSYSNGTAVVTVKRKPSEPVPA